jgi:hypothetical protein
MKPAQHVMMNAPAPRAGLALINKTIQSKEPQP